MKQLPDALTLNNKINNFVNDLVAVSGQDESALKQISDIRTELVDYVRDAKELIEAQNKRIDELSVKAAKVGVFESAKSTLEQIGFDISDVESSLSSIEGEFAKIQKLFNKVGV